MPSVPTFLLQNKHLPQSPMEFLTSRPRTKPPSPKPQDIPYSMWTAQDSDSLFIPSIDFPDSGLAEERSQYDITVKLSSFHTPRLRNVAHIHEKR